MLIHDVFPSSLAPFRSPGTAACASPLQGVAHVPSAHRVFGEMPESLEASRAGHGVASAHKTVYWKEGAPQNDSNQVLDAMPSTGLGADLNIGQVLSVTVHRMIYPLTLSVLHQVFGAYGMILKLSAVGKLVCCQVLVQYHTCESAAQAMQALQGRYIYDGCCQLDIKWAEQSELNVLENSSSSQSKPPSVTTTPKQVPTFDGTNMTRWRADCEQFFELNKIPRVLWIIAAEMNMVGDAALWWQAYKTRHVSAAWEDLCAAMLQAFGTGTDQQLREIVDHCQDIDENKILNAQSAPSQDSLCSQAQVSPVHCPISKRNEDALMVDAIFTHVGGISLFMEFCSDSADEIIIIVDDNPVKHSVRDQEILDDVVTHAGGGLPLFLAEGLHCDHEVCEDVLSKDMDWNTCMADLMLTAVGDGSLFLEFDLDLSVPPAHEVFPDKLPWKCSAFSPWSNNAFSSGYNGMQSCICFSPKQRWSGSCCNTIFIRNFMVLFQSVDHGVSLTLPWDPGDVVCIPIVETFYIFSSTETDPRHFQYRILLKCTGLFSEHNLYHLIKTHVQKYNCGLVVRIESAAMYQQLIRDPGGSVFQFAGSEPSGIIVRSWVQWDPGGLHFSICLVVYHRDPEADDSTCYFHICNNTKLDGMACDPSGCFKLLLRNDCCRTSELRY